MHPLLAAVALIHFLPRGAWEAVSPLECEVTECFEFRQTEPNRRFPIAADLGISGPAKSISTTTRRPGDDPSDPAITSEQFDNRGQVASLLRAA